MLRNLLFLYSQQVIPDVVFDSYELVIQKYILKAHPEKFRSAFRVGCSSHSRIIATHDRWKIKKFFSKCNFTRDTALHFMADGVYCDLLVGTTGLEKHTTLKYLHKETFKFIYTK